MILKRLESLLGEKRMYLIRLDDFCEYSDTEKWTRVLNILKKFSVNALIGVIPNCQSKEFLGVFEKDNSFWEKLNLLQAEGMLIALHGFNHIYVTNSGGINPIHSRSEFAGLSLEEQKNKIRKGYNIFQKHKITPFAFFAPAHTFDENTLQALKDETPIRVISDTVANDIYFDNDFYFLPVQSGRCRPLPFKFITIALHPNEMNEKDFTALENFLNANQKDFLKINEPLKLKKRKKSFYDTLISFAYFFRQKLLTKN